MEKIRTFNSAKRFAEEVIHPIIKSQSEAKITANLGAISIIEADKLSPAKRIINRYNAAKERTILQQTLINEIEATVLINGNVAEKSMLKKIKDNLEEIEDNFDDRKDEIMTIENSGGIKKPKLTKLFKEINRYLDNMYVQVQQIMTKNKLLFTSDNEEWLDDIELKEKIKNDNLKS